MVILNNASAKILMILGQTLFCLYPTDFPLDHNFEVDELLLVDGEIKQIKKCLKVTFIDPDPRTGAAAVGWTIVFKHKEYKHV